MKIAMTGVSGNMGSEALCRTLELAEVRLVRVLLTPRRRNARLAKKLRRRYGGRVETVFGRLEDPEACRTLVEGMDYVVHMAAVIPPRSDADPAASEACNFRGTQTLVSAVAAMPRRAKLIHVSTIALYGCRNEKHPFCRVGDPLLISPYDWYSLHKLYGERCVLESGLEHWVVLRQTAMLHNNMLKSNMSDGLMFHTCLNSPLEWVSARDSGYLIRRILERDAAGEVDAFWKKVYNIGAGLRGRQTGYDTFGDGFSVIGGTTESFFRPDWMSARNFHGVWLADSGVLEELFGFQRDGVADVWRQIAKKHRVYKLAKLVPKKLIERLVFRRLLDHPNAPSRWRKDGDEARVMAYFGDEARQKALPVRWEEVKLMAKGDFGDYDAMRDEKNAVLLSHGFDDTKPVGAWTIEDARSAALFRGGACLSPRMEGAYRPLTWRCAEGHVFEASPYTVMGAGHWCPHCAPMPWDFDRQAKKNPFYAQVWYDTHDADEQAIYAVDEEGRPVLAHAKEK